MQKTVELIETTIRHLQRLLEDPDTTPDMKRAATKLISHLTDDLEIAKLAAGQN